MGKASVETLIAEANARLRAAKIGCKIELRGDRRLWLRGTFPDKKGIRAPYQQRIALKQVATQQTIKDAEQLCKVIGIELNQGTFDWRKFGDGYSGDTVGQWVERFEADRWRRVDRNHQTLSTWSDNYLSFFNALDPRQSLTVNYLVSALNKTEPNSASRLKQVLALAALAEFAGLDATPIKRLKGSYSSSSAGERELPSDDEIVELVEWLKGRNRGWYWIVAMLATYGLRSHELWYLNWEQFPVLRVLDGTKTGERITVPLHPEWAERWKLDEQYWPKFRGDFSQNKLMGVRICKGFENLGLPMKPYDLRHAWARRVNEYPIRDETAAKLMGHSPTVHRKVYERWIGNEHLLSEYERAIQQMRG